MGVSAKEWDTAKNAEFTLEPKIAFFKNLCPQQDIKVLEYGCAFGRVTNLFFQAGYRNIVGFDTSKGQIEAAREKCPAVHHLLHHYFYDPSTQWREGVSLVPLLPLADNAFDAIICCAVITCLPQTAAYTSALSEITRVMKPGGLLYLAEFLRPLERTDIDDGLFVSEKFHIRMKHYSKSELHTILAGFIPVHFEESAEISTSGKPLRAYHCFVRKPNP